MEKFAYVTLMANNEYLEPALVLMNSGKETNSKYPLYIMITAAVSKSHKEVLEMIGYKIIEIKEYIPENYYTIFTSSGNKGHGDGHGQTLKDCGGVHAFSKLHIWSLIQFDKVCFLDLDLLIIQNLDEVFNYPSFSCAWRDNGMVCSQMMVVEPNIALYVALISFADNYCINYERYQMENVLYTDEDVLSDFFLKRNILPRIFDYQSGELDIKSNTSAINDCCKIKAVHFTDRTKPGIVKREFLQKLKEEHYIYAYYGSHYVTLLEQSVQQLSEKGINIYEI